MDSSVSVVIPHFNSASTLVRALETVKLQSNCPKEVLVIDDKSADVERCKVREIVQRFDGVRLIELPENQGPGVARNRGWDEASGEWIAFLDCDDVWHPRKLEIQLEVAAADRAQISLVGAKSRQISSPAELAAVDVPSSLPIRTLSVKKLLMRNSLATSGVILRRSLRHRFTEGRRYSEDYELWLKVAGEGHAIRTLDVPLVGRFKAPYGETGLSSHVWRMIVGEYGSYWSAGRATALTSGQVGLGFASSTVRSVVRLSRILGRRMRGRPVQR